MKILIVEDEEILSKVLEEKFKKENFNVSVAVDGEGVMPLAKKDNPDLILLDLILPKKSGFEVLGELKADLELKMIPVIVLSNLGQDEEIKNALSLGAVDYLVKTEHPINEVVEKVKQNLIKGK
ncbi:MAG: response regulator [Patescibacteria group bacterium]|nr:response regulator [Patescibacteria group bacterium]